MRTSRPWRTLVCGVIAATGIALGTGTAQAVPIGQTMNGKMTYYNDRGYGACGTPIDATSQDLVAVSAAWWTSPNPNNDPLCSGVKVQVTYNGRTITVPVREQVSLLCLDPHRPQPGGLPQAGARGHRHGSAGHLEVRPLTRLPVLRLR